MQKALLAVALSLNTKNNAVCAVSLVRGFCRKKSFEPPKNTYNSCHGNQSVSCDQALDKLSEKLNSRLLVHEEHGFQRGGTLCPLATGDQKNAQPG